MKTEEYLDEVLLRSPCWTCSGRTLRFVLDTALTSVSLAGPTWALRVLAVVRQKQHPRAMMTVGRHPTIARIQKRMSGGSGSG